MVEPERVLHSVMVIAFERKGIIDSDLKIIRAVLSELQLDQEHAADALADIRQLRGEGDWSGKRDSIIGVAISRIEEGIADGMVSNSGVTGALKRLIEATEVGSAPDEDPLTAFEEEFEENEFAALGFDEPDSSPAGEEASSTESSIDDSSESDEIDDEDIDPFELLGAGEMRGTDASSDEGYTDPLDALMEDDEFEDESQDAFAFSEEESSTPRDDEKASESDSTAVESHEGEGIIDMYRMMLETVWVDDLIDPSEVKLLTRKREELGISFETHLRLVKEMLEDGT